ncbi:hypothetical protein DQG13_29080 [Paenibacillus sp. YN15]|nr:hypothetical protein DQG13_29080 [Paenibacillus sp. YN15]
MGIAVISYSLTGNNRKLAAAVAAALSAEHIEICLAKPSATWTIILGMVLGRTPKVQPHPSVLEKYDRVLFFAPVWMGKVASPLRAYLRQLKTRPQPYAFASISGGALNPNPKLAEDISNRAGAKPAAFLNLYITDLLPPDSKATTMKDTSSYLLNDGEIKKLVGLLEASPVWSFC